MHSRCRDCVIITVHLYGFVCVLSLSAYDLGNNSGSFWGISVSPFGCMIALWCCCWFGQHAILSRVMYKCPILCLWYSMHTCVICDQREIFTMPPHKPNANAPSIITVCICECVRVSVSVCACVCVDACNLRREASAQ